MNFTLRQAKPEDWEIIQKLHIELHADNHQYDTFLDQSWPIDERGITYYKDVTSDPYGITFIAEVDDMAVGYLAGGKKDITYRTVSMSEIHSMSVSPRFQSQGIGESLIRKFKEWSKEHGYQKVYVNVYYTNERGIKFYKKCGLLPIDMSLEMDV